MVMCSKCGRKIEETLEGTYPKVRCVSCFSGDLADKEFTSIETFDKPIYLPFI